MKNYIVIISLLISNIAYSSFVVGPSDATAVFGPAEPKPTFTVEDLKLSYSKETDKRIQEAASKLDAKNEKLVCTYDEETVKLLNLTSGVDRLENFSDSVVMMDAPNLAKSVGDEAGSLSVGMSYMTEMFGTSILSSNEYEIAIKRNAYFKKCNNLKNFTQNDGELQLYNYSCLIYQMLIHMDNLASDSDALYQKTVGLQATLNQAIAETAAREASIANAEKKINENAKELKDLLGKIKETQKKINKLQEDLSAANERLAAAQSIECDEDCSGRDAAVQAAQAEVDKIQKELKKEEEKFAQLVEDLIKLLTEKFKSELNGVLALLSGTIKGVAGSNDISFKINGENFVLLDSGMQINDPKYKQHITDHWGNYKLNNPNGTREEFDTLQTQSGTNTFFGYLQKHMDMNDNGKQFYDIWGNKTEGPIFPATGLAGQNVDLKHILNEFTSMGSHGLDNITTIALAVSDYSETQKANAQQNKLQSLLEPQKRVNYISGKISEANALNESVRKMMSQNICYINNVLSLYKALYKQVVTEDKNKKIDPFLKYLNEFKTNDFNKKLEEGYTSKVSISEIVKDYERAMENSSGLIAK